MPSYVRAGIRKCARIRALSRPDKLRRFRDGMCAVVGMVRKKKNMELQWGRSIAAGAVDCWKRGMNDQQ